MKRVRVKTFLKTLEQHRGTKIVTLVSKTEPEMVQKHRITGEPNPYFGQVDRICKRHGILGAVYSNAVNNQRLREGQPEVEPGVVETFIPEKLWNGKGQHDTRFTVRHSDSGDRYLVLFPRSDAKGTPVVLEDMYVDRQTGTVLTLEELEPFLKNPSSNKRQGTDKKIPWRVIELKNLEQIQLDSEIYVLT